MCEVMAILQIGPKYSCGELILGVEGWYRMGGAGFWSLGSPF